MENIRQKIADIITHTHKTPLEQADEILLLFSVSVSVCPKCGSTDLFKSQKAELYDCKCCGLRWANER